MSRQSPRILQGSTLNQENVQNNFLDIVITIFYWTLLHFILPETIQGFKQEQYRMKSSRPLLCTVDMACINLVVIHDRGYLGQQFLFW